MYRTLRPSHGWASRLRCVPSTTNHCFGTSARTYKRGGTLTDYFKQLVGEPEEEVYRQTERWRDRVNGKYKKQAAKPFQGEPPEGRQGPNLNEVLRIQDQKLRRQAEARLRRKDKRGERAKEEMARLHGEDARRKETEVRIGPRKKVRVHGLWTPVAKLPPEHREQVEADNEVRQEALEMQRRAWAREDEEREKLLGRRWTTQTVQSAGYDTVSLSKLGTAKVESPPTRPRAEVQAELSRTEPKAADNEPKRSRAPPEQDVERLVASRLEAVKVSLLEQAMEASRRGTNPAEAIDRFIAQLKARPETSVDQAPTVHMTETPGPMPLPLSGKKAILAEMERQDAQQDAEGGVAAVDEPKQADEAQSEDKEAKAFEKALEKAFEKAFEKTFAKAFEKAFEKSKSTKGKEKERKRQQREAIRLKKRGRLQIFLDARKAQAEAIMEAGQRPSIEQADQFDTKAQELGDRAADKLGTAEEVSGDPAETAIKTQMLLGTEKAAAQAQEVSDDHIETAVKAQMLRVKVTAAAQRQFAARSEEDDFGLFEELKGLAADLRLPAKHGEIGLLPPAAAALPEPPREPPAGVAPMGPQDGVIRRIVPQNELRPQAAVALPCLPKGLSERKKRRRLQLIDREEKKIRKVLGLDPDSSEPDAEVQRQLLSFVVKMDAKTELRETDKARRKGEKRVKRMTRRAQKTMSKGDVVSA